MNTLEKSLLIKELHDLTSALSLKKLSLYETAKAKTRIKEIFMRCDEPIFQKQLLAFKTQLDPIQTAQEFAQQSLYAQSFRGVFTQVEELETALYQQPESGWAMLYHARTGWQIWLIPAENRSALLSEFQDLEQTYRWLLEQQQQYNCLKIDAELNQVTQLAQLQAAEQQIPQVLPTVAVAEADTNSTTENMISFDLITEPTLVSKADSLQIERTEASQPEMALEPIENQVIATPIVSEANDNTDTTSALLSTAQATAIVKPSSNKVKSLQLNQYDCPISALNLVQNESAELYRVFVPEVPELTQYADVVVHLSTPEEDQQQVLARAVYVAEQTDLHGKFVKYVVLLGALDQMQAIRLMRSFCQQFEHELAAVSEISWEKLQSHLFDFDRLFKCYSHTAQVVWQQENYFPFIPVQHVHATKFIQFEESEAQSQTPLILLKERQKIRLIHGQKRLQLSRTEQAVPHILLDRQHGISWQMIQKIISQLQQPIDALQLCQAIQMHQEN